ncbi:ThiF family adenylyltransferase [Alkalibacillus salilacus]|uniref:Adenylyltransferase/sulfurtransferase n=1 Tax=Alkalibacillus salilacus TaxID=284582 RepID=A0ABT9VBG1_9BACI|nr:ThiF family adenylyltransferase [Alkalibacillus salilacus]MDQ0158283.1 adenylyltransferase/sulfurtransferase [Alkalibacillus salilacus]
MTDRYARQARFKEIGQSGQNLIKESTVTIIGCGALGTAQAEMLVRSGVKTIHLVDRDVVEWSNLQRQQLFTEDDALEMVPKVIAAEKRLHDIRSDVTLHTYLEHADADLIKRLAEQSDILLDATDNFETRLVINDVCHQLNKAWVYGACIGSTSVVFPILPGETACLRCIVESIPLNLATCENAGILASTVQITASRQCNEVWKYLTGQREQMLRKLCIEDVWEMDRQLIGISKVKRDDCLTCGETPSYPALKEHADVAVLCGRDTVQLKPSTSRHYSLEDIESSLKEQHYSYQKTPFFIQFYAENHRVMAFHNGRILVHETKDERVGRKIFHQLFG